MAQAGQTTETQDLLFDAFQRVRERVVGVTDGVDAKTCAFRPDPSANSIAWLVWHLARIQDDHVADVAGVRQAWLANGWAQRFSLPFDDHDTGYGHHSDQVAAVAVDAQLLADYHADVDALTTAFVGRIEPGDLDRVVDERWDPPVTLGVRLVSVISDCLQHVGQAEYVRGIAERRS
jgi:Protein of unknown function (DUF664)